MGERRAHGTGSVYQDARGYWYAQVEAGWTSRGTRRYARRVAKNERHANRLVRELLRADPATLTGNYRTTTVKTWADAWLKIHVDQVRPHAYATDRSAVTRWIVPTIGHKRLTNLTPGDIRAVDRAQRDTGLAPASVVRTRGVLVKMLRDARLEGHQVPDRIFDVPSPSAGESSRDEIPLDHALTILDVAATRPDSARWAAAFLQGIRPAEARGLTWSHVHEDQLDISWQLKTLPYLDNTDKAAGFRVPPGFVAEHLWKSYHLVRPKTASGRRIIPLTPWMAQALSDHRDRQTYSPHGLVWPRPTGQPLPETTDRAAWKQLLSQARARQLELDPTATPMPHYDLYSARHTTVNLLLRAGVDKSVVEAIVGHSKLVANYRHVNHAETRNAIERLAGALGRT